MAKTDVDHGSRDHADFNPSSLKYVEDCPGFENWESPDTSLADRGTRVHEACETGDTSFLQSEEEVELYETTIQLEREFLTQYFPVDERNDPQEEGFAVHREIRLHIDLDGEKTFGTCDKLIIAPDGITAVMLDYKTGFLSVAHPSDNLQTFSYVSGVFQAHPRVQEVDFAFILTQHNRVEHHTFRREELPHLVRRIRDTIRRAKPIRERWREGCPPELEQVHPTNNCRFCLRQEECPALGALVVAAAKEITQRVALPDLGNLDDNANLEQLYDLADILGNWVEKIQKLVKDRLLEGQSFPSLHLRNMGTTTSCTDNALFAKMAGDFGLSPEELISKITLPVAKVADAVSSTAQKGEKGKVRALFLDACETAGLLKKGEPRFSVTR